MEVRSTNTGITYPNSGWTKGSGPKNEVALTTQHVGEKKQLNSIIVIKQDLRLRQALIVLSVLSDCLLVSECSLKGSDRFLSQKDED